MGTYQQIEVPEKGRKIEKTNGGLKVPDNPIIPFIEGDGIGPEVMNATRKVLDATVKKAYQGDREIVWLEIYAGGKAQEKYGELLPEDTFKAIEEFLIAIKGPLTTPIGAGYRSLNVALRQQLGLYACVRPVKYIPGTPSPMKNPEEMDMVIFRENTEDLYAGIEWEEGTEDAQRLINFIQDELGGSSIRVDSGVGIKPISRFATKRLVRKAIEYAIKNDRSKVTLVHKGNIMKYTEGAFREWGYEVAEEEFGDKTVTEDKLWEKHDGQLPADKILINDRVADNMLQQLITRTRDYDILAAPNVNGDYISDAAAGQVGGLGVAPGSNIGDYIGLFEPTHGTAPKYAGQDKVNPTSLILSGTMMLEYMGWKEAADLIRVGLEKTIKQKKVTYDLARQMEGATKVGTSGFADAIVENM